MRRIIPVLPAILLIAGCSTFPKSVREDIAKENDKLEQARKEIARVEASVKDDFAKVPDLFNGTSVISEWPARLGVARQKLDRAEADRRNIEQLTKSKGRQALPEIERLLAEQQQMRKAAM